MVFCFALVLVQQHQANVRTAAAKQAYEKSHAPLSSSTIKTLEPLTPITVSAPPAAPAGNTMNQANSPIAAPAQPSKASGTNAQGAGQHSGPVIIDVPKTINQTKSLIGL